MIQITNLTPMMADVLSGAVPAPVDWTPGADPAAWWAASSAGRHIGALDEITIAPMAETDDMFDVRRAGLHLLVTGRRDGDALSIAINGDGTLCAVLAPWGCPDKVG